MKNKKIIKLIFLILFLSYLISFIISESGYYEYKLQERTILTNEEITKFENDVKNGENVDLNDYIIKNKKDYSNKFNNSLTKVSNKINKNFTKIVSGIFKIMSKLISK